MILTSGLDHPSAVAVDSTNVYWTEGQAISKCAIGGCPQSTKVAPASYGARLAVDSTSVYWTEGPEVGTGSFGAFAVMKCPLGGCTQPTLLAGGPAYSYAFGIALDSTRVYWIGGYGVNLIDLRVESCGIDGCDAATRLATIYSGAIDLMNSTFPIALDSTSIYWIGRDVDAGLFGTVGTISKCAVTGCNLGPTVLASRLSGPRGVAVDSASVYWTNHGDGTVMKCAVGGCAAQPTVLASCLSGPTGIAVDSASVYWTNDGDGTVMKCAVGGCAAQPIVLASGLNGPTGIAVDSTSVYWANSGDGTVMKVKK